MRKSVTYLMSLKADVADRQREVNELATDLADACSDIGNITTEEARSESYLDDHIKQAKKVRNKLGKELKELEIAVAALRKSFGYNNLQK